MSLIKETTSLVGFGVLAVVGAGAIMAVVSAVSLGIYYFTAPATVAIDNRVFHNSQPYTDGMARDLDNLCRDYQQSDDAGKVAIAETIRHRFAGYDRNQLPIYLQQCLGSIN